MNSEKKESEPTLWDRQFKEDVKSGNFFWLTNKWVVDFERGHFKNFWELYEKLPKEIKGLADNNFINMKKTVDHSTLNIIRIGRYWSMQVGEKNRALGVEVGEDGLLWCWIGSYSEYNSFIETLNKDKK